MNPAAPVTNTRILQPRPVPEAVIASARFGRMLPSPRSIYACFDRFPTCKGASTHSARFAPCLFDYTGGGLLYCLGDATLLYGKLRWRPTARVTSDHQRRVAKLFPSVHASLVANGIDAKAFAILDMDRSLSHSFRKAQVGADRRVIGLFGQLKQKKGGAAFLGALCASPLRGRAHPLIVGELEAPLAERQQQMQGEVE